MSKKDYTKFSKNQNGGRDTSEHNHVQVEYVSEHPIDGVTPEAPVVDDVLEHKPLIFGKVVSCLKLNVRQHPSLDADILCCLVEHSEIEIDEDKSTDEFYAICTPTGLEGFCLKKFIEISK